MIGFLRACFFNPSTVNSYVKENIINAEIAKNHILELQNRFAAPLTEQAVRNSFLYSQSAEDIYERSRIFGMLMETTSGLQSVQFVNSNGIRVHYSASERDIISQSAYSTVYRNYYETPFALPFDKVHVPDGNSARFTMDTHSDRIIFSYPFYDSMDVYRGSALFTVLIRAVAERLIAEGRLKVSDDILVIGEPPGILLGSPEVSRADIIRKVSGVWNEGIQGRVTLDTGDSGVSFSLISFRTDNGMFVGRLVNDLIFSIPDSMRIVLQLSIFLTFYLTVFFLMNIKANPEMLLKNRIKRLREILFEQLYVNNSSQERVKWILELEQRRTEILAELKQNLRFHSRQEKNINGIINKSWDELLAVIKSGCERALLEKISVPQEPEETEGLEELEEAEELEETEDIEEAEELEELEGIEETEALETETDVHAGKEDPVITQKRLMILASEIEFSHDYPVKEEDEPEEELPVELDIVSPFSSMFSSLGDKKTKENAD